MKNVTQQGETYHFRIAVPKDCVEAVGKKEIFLSLGTKSWEEAGKRAAPLRKEWKAEFKRIRNAAKGLDSQSTAGDDPDVSESSSDYLQHYRVLMEKNLPALIDHSADEELPDIAEHYVATIEYIQNADSRAPRQLDLPELEETGPLPSGETPGQTRKKRRALVTVLHEMEKAVTEELREPLKKETSPSQSTSKSVVTVEQPSVSTGEETDLLKVAELLIQSKTRNEATNSKVRAEVRHLKDWTLGKSDITKFTKADLIDYVQNCLPHIPAFMHQKEKYKNKTLRQCVALTQKDPNKYPPLSYKTCENTLMRLNMVFNYAKDFLGVIPVNPVKGIEIPKVNAPKEKPKAFTKKELKDMWKALTAVHLEIGKRPSRYWVTVLSLYHGFRLNEPCSLFLKDVYEDEDGIWVMDLNEDGPGKTLKNKSSFRVIPVHPYVLNDLGFKAFVEAQKARRREGLLFDDLTLTKDGYKRKISHWFAKWKEEWLDEKNTHKNFHSLRHTFIRQAQNQAKISDRCAQEITGHSVDGVSAVHLGYSGALPPKAMLEELKELQYGWENEPVVFSEPPEDTPPKKKTCRKKKRKTATKKKASK
jgi:integrase